MDAHWREFLRNDTAFIRLQRLHSQAFVRGEALSVIPLQFNSKEQFRSDPNYQFEGWSDVDLPPDQNWGALFPARTKDCVAVDLDIDAKPLDGGWTPALERAAGQVAQTIIGAMKALGVDCRHAFGRRSQDGWGHVFLPVAVAGKEDVQRLAGLGMRRAIVIGKLKVRVEVRLAPEKMTTRKPLTLPGSVYPGRSDPDAYDPIMWQLSPRADLLEEASFPKLPSVPLRTLIKGLYGGLLAAFVAPAYDEGSRHEIALRVAGVLAREASDEASILDNGEGDAETILGYICDTYGDDEKPDRMQALHASFAAAEAGRPITGYARLSEDIGEEARTALLRLRGGDPDVLADLFEKVAYVHHASGKDDVYLDLSTRGHGSAVVCTEQAIIRHFHPHPAYPPRETSKGKVLPLIEIVIRSSRRQQYDRGVRLPGVPFGTVLVHEGGQWREATEGELGSHDVVKAINIGTGFATPFVAQEEVDQLGWARWWRMWKRHLKPLTGGDPVAAAKLDKAIAWAVQFPLEKVPLGLVLTGGGGIGKSVLFQTILPRILGQNLIGVANVLALEGQFRLGDLEGKKFYVIEEANLTHAHNEIKELLKDLMKNSRTRVNIKFGAEGAIDNFAIPVFLTNEENPNLQIQGQRERSLAVIQGDTREKLGMSLLEWQRYTNTISDHVKELVAALDDPAVREAAMYYFMTLDVERRDFEDNSDVGDLVDVRAALAPVDEAICQLIELNELHPKMPQPLTAPFRAEILKASIERLMQARGIKNKPTSHAIMKKFRSIFGDVVEKKSFYHETLERTCNVMYFNIKYGEMIKRAKASLGIELTPAYELTEADFGLNDITDPKICAKAYNFRLDNLYSFNDDF